LLLIRIAETTCEETWMNLREELQHINVGTFAGPAGTLRQRTGTIPPSSRSPSPSASSPWNPAQPPDLPERVSPTHPPIWRALRHAASAAELRTQS
jgi:hypothetical protein